MAVIINGLLIANQLLINNDDLTNLWKDFSPMILIIMNVVALCVGYLFYKMNILINKQFENQLETMTNFQKLMDNSKESICIIRGAKF